MTARGRTDNLKDFIQKSGYDPKKIIFIGTGSGDPCSKVNEVKSLINKFNPTELVYYENCEDVLEEMIYGENDLNLTTSFYLLDVEKENFNYKLIVKGANCQ